MGIPQDRAQCPTCGGALAKPPLRKTRCPHCGDTMYVKYRPGQSPEQRQIVGSKEAEEIERAWQHDDDADEATVARRAGYAAAEKRMVERMMTETFPAGLVMFYVTFRGPLRDGDAFDARYCHDKKVHTRVVDLQAGAIVDASTWTRQPTTPARTEVLIRPLVDGVTIQVVGANSRSEDRTVRIPNRWQDAWPLYR